MIGSRFLGAACAAILVSSLGALAGCSADTGEKSEGATAATIQAASVSLAVYDENGVQVGDGSGILISPRVVLTSGHLIAGKGRWTVTNGKKQANGVRGLTYDWMNYEGSDKSHPRKHDVGVIYLDRPIELAAYPKVSAEKLASGAQATRVRSNGGSFQQLPAKLGKFSSFPHAYVTDIPSSEQLDTGGAVVNDKFEVVGLVTGRGKETGKLHIARTNDLTAWLAPKIACGHKSSKGLNVRTYGVPGDDDTTGTAGNPNGSNGSSNGSNGSNGSNNGSNGSSGDSNGSNGSNNGDNNGSNGSNNGDSGTDGIPSSCNDGGGGFNSDGSPNPSTNGGSSPSDSSSGGSDDSSGSGNPSGSNNGLNSGNPSGSNGSSSSDGSSSTGNPSDGSTTGTGSNSGNPSGSNNGSNGSNSGNPSDGSNSGNPSGSNSGSSSSDGSSSTGNPNGSNSGSTGNSGSTSGSGSSNPNGSSTNGSNPNSGSGDVETCTGTHDNADVCPPEANGCSGSSCGGGEPDDTIDYGACNSCKKNSGSGNLNIH